MTSIPFPRLLAAMVLSLALAAPTQAAALKSASITAIVNEVNVVNSGQGIRPAKLNETISGQSSVQTGLKSRTELLFSDNTMARLGANSMFSFTNGTRDIDLKQGTMLLQVPKGAGGAKITTAAVTAAITGTTIMVEYFPGGYSKVIVLEGTLRLFLNNRVGESILLEPGKMIILSPNATQLPEPVDVDLKRLVKTSKLIKAIDGTEMDLTIVEKEIEKQDKEKAKGDLIGTNLVITGSGTEVILASEDLLNTLQNAAENQQQLLGENYQGGGSGPTPPDPSKYNPATTITSPDPYIINNSTTIVTDPTITTNGVTDQGTIYNSTVQPGNTSDFMFGSTSTFDTDSGFNTSYIGKDYSVFKFAGLQFDGNPTLVTAGGPSLLFLISESDITTSPSAFSLDFTGLDFLGLATVNGYISLAHPVTGAKRIDLHARGTGASFEGNIFIDAPITLGSGSTIGLYAESAVNLNSTITADIIDIQTFGDFNSSSTAIINGVEIEISAANQLNLYTPTIDTAGLVTLTLNGGGIFLHGSQDYSGVNAVINAGVSGLNADPGASLLNATSILSLGDITFTGGPGMDLSSTGIIAAAGNINATGSLSAGSIGSGSNTTAGTINSASNINSTTGGITTTIGDMTATNNITAASIINSAGGITAGDLISGSSITAASQISGASITSTVSSITSTGGAIYSNTGGISSAQDINAGGGFIQSAAGITAAGDIIANGDIAANGGISGNNILANGNGASINAGGALVAAGDLGTLYANTSTVSSVSINANRILGGDDPGAASGATTFTAPTITVGDVVTRNGDNPIVLNGTVVTITAQTTNLSAGNFSANVSTLTVDGAGAITVALGSDLGSSGTPLDYLYSNANVTFSGPGSVYVNHGTLGGSIITSGNLYTAAMSLEGNLTAGQIRRTSYPGMHTLSVNGTIEANITSGISFGGAGGTIGSDGGSLTLTGNSLNFGSGTGKIDGAFFGGGSSSSGNAGNGGLFYANSSTSFSIDGGSVINASGGDATGGIGGNGGGLYLSLSNSGNFISSGNLLSQGGASDLSGGNGGAIELSANSGASAISLGTAGGGSINVSGGDGLGGSGGAGGIIRVKAQGAGGSVSTVPYFAFLANGGTGSSGLGGNGGLIELIADSSTGSITHGSYSTSTANGGASTGFTGGSGGNIVMTGGSVITNSSTTLNAIGGTANSTGFEGGNGGTFTAASGTGQDVSLNGQINLTTGVNGAGITYGGTGGTATVNSGGQATVTGTIKVSEDTGPAMSKNGGNIDITANDGITISNTGQLHALLANASPGKGGRINLISNGGNINVAGTADAGKKGGSGVVGTDGVLKIVNNGAGGGVDIASTAILRGDVIKVGALSNNGVLTIHSGSTINADSQIRLFGGQGAGTVLFTGGGTVSLNAGSAIAISANTVQINAGTTVNNVAPSTTVYSNNHNYNGGGYGSFQNPVTNGGAPLPPGSF